MEQIEFLNDQQAACLTHLEELANAHFAKEISLLCSIPGIKRFSAYCILAEIGNDMSYFPKATPVSYTHLLIHTPVLLTPVRFFMALRN